GHRQCRRFQVRTTYGAPVGWTIQDSWGISLGMSAAAGEQIVLRDVSKRYETASGTVPAVEDVNIAVRAREFVALLGPSGCGKSTVLGMIGGVVRPDAGRVAVRGVALPRPRPPQR